MYVTEKMAMEGVTCGCTVPCERVFYHPSLSYAQLSTFNVEELVIGSDSRKKLIQSSFESSVDVSHSVVRTLVTEERDIASALRNSIDEIVITFKDNILPLDNTEDLAEHLSSPDLIIELGDVLQEFDEMIKTSISDQIDAQTRTETIQNVNNQIFQNILNPLKNPKLMNTSGIFDDCVEHKNYTTPTGNITRTTVSSLRLRKKRGVSDAATTPAYKDNGVNSKFEYPGHAYRYKRGANTTTTYCSKVVSSIFPYYMYYNYNEYLDDDNLDERTLLDLYQINYTTKMVQLFNTTHVHPNDFSEHHICMSSLDYLLNVTDPAITIIVKAVKELRDINYNDRNRSAELLKNIEQAIEQGNLRNDDNIYNQLDNCLWPGKYIATFEEDYMGNTFGSTEVNQDENDLVEHFLTIIYTSIHKSSTLSTDFDLLKRKLQNFMDVFTEDFLQNKRYILQYKDMGLSKDYIAKYATNSHSSKISHAFFSTLNDFEIQLKYLHNRLDTICSLSKDWFDTLYRLALPAFKDSDLFDSCFWDTFVYNTSNVYLLKLSTAYTTDRRQYIQEIINQIFEPHLTFFSDLMTNISQQRENIFNSLNDLETNMNDFLMSKKMKYDFYM